MPERLQQLLGVRGLDGGDAAVNFGFAVPVAAWHWPVLAGLALLAAGWMYRRSDAPLWAKVPLVALRALLLLVLVTLLFGPRLSRSSEVVEGDVVVVLVDRSGSLSVADVKASGGGGNGGGASDAGGGAGPAARITREQQLERALAQAAGTFRQAGGPVGLGGGANPGASATGGAGNGAGTPGGSGASSGPAGRRIIFVGFDSGTMDLPLGPTGLPKLGAPTGARTDLNAGLEAALARASGRPLAGVLVLSDGRLSEPVSRATLRKLEAQRVGLYTVPLGSPDAAEDLAIKSAEATAVAFTNDAVPVRVEVGRSGTPTSKSVEVQLVDQVSGAVLDKRTVALPAPAGAGAGAGAGQGAGGAAGAAGGDATVPVLLVGSTREPGKRTWQVRLVAGPGDLIAENNTRSIDLDITDRPLRVLLLDGYPRWEYRYLKNILAREKSLEFSSLLLSPNRRYIQEGSITLDGAPTTAEGWSRFDVVILGDVKPDVFSGEQIEQLRARVADSGAGLLWIAGSSAVPDAWRPTRMDDLLPFGRAGLGSVPSGGARSTPMWDQDIVLRPTALAERLNILRLADSASAGGGGGADAPSPELAPGTDASAPASVKPGAEQTGWPAALSDPGVPWAHLRWAQRIERSALKPATEVLAEGVPAVTTGPNPSAVVTTMRFGAGRVIYVATDEIWRYRYGRGEDLPERFWIQLIRLLGREAAAKSGRPAVLEVTPARATVGQPVDLSLTLIDQSLVDGAPARVTVKLSAIAGDGTPGEELGTVELYPTSDGVGGSGGAGSASGPSGRREYAGSWLPQRAGRVAANVTDTVLTARGAIAAEAVVAAPDDELRRPEADHATLAELARQTGGAMIQPADLARWPGLMPNREIRQTSVAEVRTLWDTPLALVLIVTLLGLEWVIRRLVRLV